MIPEDLIHALEAATEPSRELDAEIARALGWVETQPTECEGHFPWMPRDEPGCQPPCYTSSLDDARTLIPAGWRVVRLEWGKHPEADRDYCHCVLETDADRMGRDLEDWELDEVEARNCSAPEFALCIAALKAHQERRS